MRLINEAILHATYTKPSMDVGFETVDLWHSQRGFCSPSGIHCGYHKIVRRDGQIEDGRPYSEVGAHCKGHNSHSIGIALEGGMDEDGKPDCNFTMAQYETLSMLWAELDIKFPGIKLSGHRDYSDKECPCFDVNELLGN